MTFRLSIGKRDDSHHAAGIINISDLSLRKTMRVQGRPPPPDLVRLIWKGRAGGGRLSGRVRVMKGYIGSLQFRIHKQK
jgi:hypothetical protein